MNLIIKKILDPLTIVLTHLDKIREYFDAKIVHNPELVRQPLFTDMHHPKQEQVGVLQPLKCGHNGRFRITDLITLEKHLEAAGFLLPIEEEPDIDKESIRSFSAIEFQALQLHDR